MENELLKYEPKEPAWIEMLANYDPRDALVMNKKTYDKFVTYIPKTAREGNILRKARLSPGLLIIIENSIEDGKVIVTTREEARKFICGAQRSTH